ncbi:MAG: twin-arginine translocation signal domain-containing protein [Chloroflexi bacterium]|nr:twin-arginine translocation signal domain-containing protein [Chloroflexota bacterium]
MTRLSRRDFLKLSTSTFAGLAFSPFIPALGSFDDAGQVRVAASSVNRMRRIAYRRRVHYIRVL